MHENQALPPALSYNGEQRDGNKSKLLAPLEALNEDEPPQAPRVDLKVLDGAFIVQMLSPAECKTFSEYSEQVFVPYLKKKLESTDRLDLVWDTYPDESLKWTTRDRRGVGVQQQVLPDTKIPHNWHTILSNDKNKMELFTLPWMSWRALLSCSIIEDVGIAESMLNGRNYFVSETDKLRNIPPSQAALL